MCEKDLGGNSVLLQTFLPHSHIHRHHAQTHTFVASQMCSAAKSASGALVSLLSCIPADSPWGHKCVSAHEAPSDPYSLTVVLVKALWRQIVIHHGVDNRFVCYLLAPVIGVDIYCYTDRFCRHKMQVNKRHFTLIHKYMHEHKCCVTAHFDYSLPRVLIHFNHSNMHFKMLSYLKLN